MSATEIRLAYAKTEHHQVDSADVSVNSQQPRTKSATVRILVVASNLDKRDNPRCGPVLLPSAQFVVSRLYSSSASCMPSPQVTAAAKRQRSSSSAAATTTATCRPLSLATMPSVTAVSVPGGTNLPDGLADTRLKPTRSPTLAEPGANFGCGVCLHMPPPTPALSSAVRYRVQQAS